MLKYNRTFADVHNVSATLGINAEKWTLKKLSAARETMEDSGVYDLELAGGKRNSSGGKTQTGTYSYLMRLNYNYAEKYLAEFLGRRMVIPNLLRGISSAISSPVLWMGLYS